jgi:hypothetical protein
MKKISPTIVCEYRLIIINEFGGSWKMRNRKALNKGKTTYIGKY